MDIPENQKLEKIFAEAHEEIIFTVEKLRESDATHIIILTPEHAILTSSIVNLKLLARQAANLNKVIIIVTQSEFALLKSEKAGVLTVKSADEIDDAAWIDAQRFYETNQGRSKPDHLKNPHADTTDNQIETESSEKIKQLIKSTRLAPKEISIGNFEIYSGGDLRIDNAAKEKFGERNDEAVKKNKNLPNNLASSYLTDQRELDNLPKRKYKNIDSSKKYGPSKKLGKFLKIILAFFLVGIPLYFFILNQIKSVTIRVIPKVEPVSVSDTISGREDIDEINFEEKIIPLKKIMTSKGTSDSALTTGEKTTGEKSTGVVDFLNKSSNEITLNQGHKITTLTGNFDFVLAETITIPARVSELTFTRYENAPIVAANFGDQYNVESVDVKVEGFDSVSQLSGRIYRPTKGGTSETVKILSQEDLDNLKNTMIDNLKESLNSEINNLIVNGDIVLDGSQKYEEKIFEFTPAVGIPANEFSITNLEYEVSVLIANQEDVDQFADLLILDGFDGARTVGDAAILENTQINEDGSIKFDIKKESTVSSSVRIPKEDIAGISIDEFNELIDSDLDITEATIEFSPSFLPKFMKAIPVNESKIEIVIDS